jgi:hypothetical protein
MRFQEKKSGTYVGEDAAAGWQRAGRKGVCHADRPTRPLAFPWARSRRICLRIDISTHNYRVHQRCTFCLSDSPDVVKYRSCDRQCRVESATPAIAVCIDRSRSWQTQPARAYEYTQAFAGSIYPHTHINIPSPACEKTALRVSCRSTGPTSSHHNRFVFFFPGV